jgi:hypothetical protein
MLSFMFCLLKIISLLRFPIFHRDRLFLPRKVVPRMLFASVVPPSQSRATKFVLCMDIRAPNNVRCRIPRGDAGGAAVLCPFFPKKLRNRTSFILISFCAGLRDPGYSGVAVLRPLHIKVYCTSLSILIAFNNFPVASFWGADAFQDSIFF